MREILQGVIDMHVHAGPSVANRELDAGDMAKEALQAGYAGFVVKDHYFPTVMSAKLVEKHLGEGKLRVFGGIALNNSVGGINLHAVDAAYNMGAKIVYMPTVSAWMHIEDHKGSHFVGSGNTSVEEVPMTYLNDKGELQKEVHDLISYLAAHPDLILSTGHGTYQEIDALIDAAVSGGVKKIMVNHPFFLVRAPMDMIAKWGKMGAYIELNACVFKPSGLGTVPHDVAYELLQNVSVDQMILDSDFGQKNNGSPVEGLYRFIQVLMNDLKVTETQINKMTKQNPAKLLEL